MARYSNVIKGLEILRKYDFGGIDADGVHSGYGFLTAGSNAYDIELSEKDKKELEDLGWYIDDLDLWQINT